MKLYYSPGVCSLSPHIVLCELDVPYQLIRVDLATKRTENGDDFFAINPAGYVPALVLPDGNILTEGVAMMQYLATLCPAKKLVPPVENFAYYQLQQWLNFVATELHKHLGFLFRPNTPEDFKKIIQKTLVKRMDIVADRLNTQAWLVGDHFTVADAYLFTVLSWCPRLHVDLSPWPQLADYMHRIGSRPAVIRAQKEEGI